MDVNEYLADYKKSQLDPEVLAILKTANSLGRMILFSKDEQNRIKKVFVDNENLYLHYSVNAVAKCDFKTPESKIKSMPVKQIESECFSNFAIVHTDAKIVLIPSEMAVKIKNLFYESFGIPAPQVKVKAEKTSRMGKDCIIS